jgi:predicted GNAT family N-acyltransferase
MAKQMKPLIIEGIKVEEKKLGRERMYGYTFDDTIVLDPRLKPKKHFETIIHEMLHQVYPEMSERKVTVSARKLARFLWKYGFRRVDL